MKKKFQSRFLRYLRDISTDLNQVKPRSRGPGAFFVTYLFELYEADTKGS